MADWVGFDIGLKLDISFPVLPWSHSSLGLLKVGLSGDNVIIEFWGLVVLNWILIILLLPVPLMSELFFGPVKRILIGAHILIFSKVWNEIIFWMSIVMRMEVLIAARTVADWVVLGHFLGLDEPVFLWKVPSAMCVNSRFR